MNEGTATIPRSYRIRVYPTTAQRTQLARWFGAARWTWNHALERRSKAYRRRGETVSGTDVSRAITALKRTRRYGWLAEIPSSVVVQKLRDQDRAFANFFAGRARYPRFRRRANAQSVRLQLDQREVARRRRWEAGAVEIPGLGPLKYRGGRHPQQYPKMATVRRDAAGRYFVTVMVEETPAPPPEAEHTVGIDLGLKELAVLSSGDAIANPRHLKRRQRRLKREQRKLSRRQKGSGRWHTQRRRVARLYGRVSDTRDDHLHKVTRRLVDENQVLCVESLNVGGLARSPLAGSVQDAAWGELLRQLAYKAQWAGRTVVTVDRYAATTQACSRCGARTGPSGSKGLGVRHWRCSACGAVHDRDHNAAVNIRNLGVAQLLPAGSGEVTRVESGGCSCGLAAAVPDAEARTRQAEFARIKRAGDA